MLICFVNFYFILRESVSNDLWVKSGGSKGTLGRNSFIFLQFSTQILPNNRLAHPFWVWCPHLGNSGCATEYIIYFN